MVKNFKGYGYVGSTILGYRIRPMGVDKGVTCKLNFKENNNSNVARINNDYNYSKKLKKVTYRKFLKTANKE